MNDFGSRLKYIRKIRKITQKDLSKNIQVGQSTIANYENNTRFPGSLILTQISDYLGVSVDYLLGLTETEEVEENKRYYDHEYNIDTIYIDLADMLISGDIEQAKSIIKDISSSGISNLIIIERIFIPILRLTGEKWRKNEINIAEEHYITDTISKLFDFLSESKSFKQNKDLKVLFMVPSGEEHIISLKMSTEYFRQRGWSIIFIGKSIPLLSLIEILKKENVDLVVLSAITQNSLNSASYLVEAIKSNLEENSPKFLLGGNAIDQSNDRLVKSFIDYHIKSLSDLSNCLERIENRILKKQ